MARQLRITSEVRPNHWSGTRQKIHRFSRDRFPVHLRGSFGHSRPFSCYRLRRPVLKEGSRGVNFALRNSRSTASFRTPDEANPTLCTISSDRDRPVSSASRALGAQKPIGKVTRWRGPKRLSEHDDEGRRGFIP